MADDKQQSEEPLGLRRSRREKKKTQRSSKLEQIKKARETGVIEDEELETAEGLFSYVTEEEYGQIVQDRQRDAWILSDDGTYREHGREIFDEEVEAQTAKPSTAKPTKSSQRKVARPSGDIKSLVLNMGGGKKRPASCSTKSDPLLAELLLQIDESPSQPTSSKRSKQKSFTPRSSNVTTPRSSKLTTPRSSNITTPRSFDMSTSHSSITTPPRSSAHTFTTPKSSRTRSQLSPPPLMLDDDRMEDISSFTPQVDNEGDTGDDVSTSEQVTSCDSQVTSCDSQVTSCDDQAIKAEPVPAAAVSCSGWETVRETLSATTTDDPLLPTPSLPVTEGGDGESVLQFYWLDAYEDLYNQPGTVFLFGKVWLSERDTHVSCCIVVRNIERCLYFLPREKLLGPKGVPTDQTVTMEDVYAEFNQRYADKYKLQRFTSKRVTKKYAFELAAIPSESEYLEVRYSAESPAPPRDASGRSFSHVFGTNTSSMERLILHCKLKGPCWLVIKRPRQCPQNVSWCKVECSVDGLAAVGVASEQAPPPPLTVLSLSMKTVLNTATHTNEVLCVGALVHPSVSIDKPAPQLAFKSDFCTIRKPCNRQFPYKFQDHIKKKGINIEVTLSERGLLAYLLAKVHRIDPDIIIGHNISSLWLDTLQHRMWHCKVPHWSRIGRLKRNSMPKGKSASQSLCCGRLVCDVKLSARELIRARSYDLTELASSLLSVQYQTMNNDDIMAAFSHHEALTGLVTHTMDEAMLALRITHELCVLPLAYQITCIAGNTLSRTLQGGRSERNEFLLLHAFTQQGYICPDKAQFAHKALPTDPDDDAGQASRSSRRKPAYAGGLVLEPRVGLYNRLILLLDFNSLYPSIIQEYNICFTTLDHAHCSDDDGYTSLHPPGNSVPLGILPSEIRVLVQRRREVKKLMASRTITAEQRQQYDIRQKALKLTANSMYGCLGFTYSRFLAKPLAALITSKGREILSHTRDLAVKLGLEVIYGDTDSIMIDSGTNDLATAREIAQHVQAEVNKYYRLLEIGIDGIFKTMLLLKKKKYAAIAIEEKDGCITERRELKGLDIVRRDWSGIAKEAGHFVLDQILSGTNMDDLLHSVQTYLTQLKDSIIDGTVSKDKLIITKSLTKSPQDYPDRKSLPHVQVALRMMSRNIAVLAGDVVPYIVCQGDQGQSNAQRSYHPEEVTSQQLSPDTHYYLHHQVHAVLARLCEPIEGLDSAQLAEWLGMDPSSYRSRGGGEETKQSLLSLPLPDTLAEPLAVVCPEATCGRTNLLQQTQPSCNHCNTPFATHMLINVLSLAISDVVAQYYQGWLECVDCHHRTRSLPLSLSCPSCGRGRLQEEYSSAMLYKQLQSYKDLFIGDQYKLVREVVDDHLKHSAYTDIALQYLFPALRH